VGYGHYFVSWTDYGMYIGSGEKTIKFKWRLKILLLGKIVYKRSTGNSIE
jgi:hypothetical protein